jgi:acyl carrier protein
MMTLSDKYGIHLDVADATPRNLRSLDSIVAMVENKIAEKKQ